ncbi:unnamed protein product [Hyaloperonospora brassicae]|uniref:Conserved oligomeric Golgi complex subunit 8 n=1 Tax=Hyaloperonospora brassicae TaxID=162125 RepID=A0AAV0UTW5_HYABA|nr:unnamed protein product [Hyaloperonospora brassicae]
MASLKTCSLEELKREPCRLQNQAESTTQQLRNLVLQHYHVFIQSNQCAGVVNDDLAELNERMVKIETAIPELQERFGELEKDLVDVVAKHDDTQYVLEHYLQLTELLEIPQLLEACILNELFDSALDVVQLAREMFDDDASASHNVVTKCLMREVVEMTKALRKRLLQKLREDLQLALCVRIVGHIRRLDSLLLLRREGTAAVESLEYEKQLKEEFLACRNVWLKSLSRGISSSDPYQYIIQVIDIKRTSWFDTITQYSAIFGSENVDGKVDPPLCRWATTTVAEFIHTLMKQLPKVEDLSSVATILEQSLFFGGSLGRVGVDFRAVLVVYFEDHVLTLMTESWRSACRDFRDSLIAHSLSASIDSSMPTCPATPIVVASYRSSANGSASNFPDASRLAPTSLDRDDYSPPRCLMSFPLLAEFTNALLSSLNELRLCTILSLQNRLGKKYQSVIRTILFTVAEFAKENKLDLHAPGTESYDDESDTASRHARKAALTESVCAMVEVIRSELVPYLIRCFHRLFPVSSVAALSAIRVLSKEIEDLGVIMHEAGLLVSVPHDRRSAKTTADESAGCMEPESQSADAPDNNTINQAAAQAEA